MPAKLLVNGINGNKRPPDMNERQLIKRAATSAEAREVTVDEIEAARLEGDHEFADRLQVMLDEADRIRKRERAAPNRGDSAQRRAPATNLVHQPPPHRIPEVAVRR